MTYRDPPRPAPEDDELVVLRSYFDAVEAGLARASLSAEGIHAWVLESASFNPILSPAAGGVALNVRMSDAARAEAILARVENAELALDADDEPDGAVRCPRCELAYCGHERARLSTALAVSPLSALLLVPLFSTRRRWRCDKCMHVWDDPSEGPKKPTPLGLDVPRPVFRLPRPRTGTGVFIGAILGLFPLAVFHGRAGGGLLLVLSVGVGGYVGSRFGHDVCSEPSCRERLPAGVETCPRCHGALAGCISRAYEHFSAAADVRRELARLEPARLGAPRRAAKRARKRAPARKAPVEEG